MITYHLFSYWFQVNWATLSQNVPTVIHQYDQWCVLKMQLNFKPLQFLMLSISTTYSSTTAT